LKTELDALKRKNTCLLITVPGISIFLAILAAFLAVYVLNPEGVPGP